jgi:hypothetical protein
MLAPARADVDCRLTAATKAASQLICARADVGLWGGLIFGRWVTS